MKRIITLNKKQFEFVYAGFINGGNLLNQNSRSRDARYDEGKILKSLKLISSIKSDNELNRELKSDNEIIKLEQKYFDLLIKYLEAAPFPTQFSDEVADLLDHLSASEKEIE